MGFKFNKISISVKLISKHPGNRYNVKRYYPFNRLKYPLLLKIIIFLISGFYEAIFIQVSLKLLLAI